MNDEEFQQAKQRVFGGNTRTAERRAAIILGVRMESVVRPIAE